MEPELDGGQEDKEDVWGGGQGDKLEEETEEDESDFVDGEQPDDVDGD